MKQTSTYCVNYLNKKQLLDIHRHEGNTRFIIPNGQCDLLCPGLVPWDLLLLHDKRYLFCWRSYFLYQYPTLG